MSNGANRGLDAEYLPAALDLIFASLLKALDAKIPGMKNEIGQQLEKTISELNAGNPGAAATRQPVFDIAREIIK